MTMGRQSYWFEQNAELALEMASRGFVIETGQIVLTRYSFQPFGKSEGLGELSRPRRLGVEADTPTSDICVLE